MNENLNLVKILKDCPKGTKLYSTIYGEVEFDKIKKGDYSISFVTKYSNICNVTSDGKHYDYYDGDCTLFPSKNQRDWSKFEIPQKKRFDPKALKPFDKVIVRGTKISEWKCDLLSHIIKSDNYNFYICVSGSDYKYCIPYNDETKHLVGTIDEAPDFYRC